jgi:hypothetical protein
MASRTAFLSAGGFLDAVKNSVVEQTRRLKASHPGHEALMDNFAATALSDATAAAEGDPERNVSVSASLSINVTASPKAVPAAQETDSE